MDEKETKQLMKIGKGVDFNALKDVVREMNAAAEKYNEAAEEDAQIKKIRVVGLKKPNMFLLWVEAVEVMNDAEYDGLPSSSVEFYNKHVNPDDSEPDEGADDSEPDEGADDSEPDEGADDSEPPKEKKKPKKEAPKSKKISSFADLKAALKNPQRPTTMFDKFCLKGGTIENLIAEFKQYLTDSGIEFKSINTPGAAKGHIRFRQEQGYLYEEEKGKIKLVGFDAS